VQRQFLFQGEAAEFFDGVDHAVGVGRGAAHQQDRVAVDELFDGFDVDAKVLADRRVHGFNAEVLGGFFEGDVDCFGDDHFRRAQQQALVAGHVAIGFDGQQAAFGAAGGHGADGLFVAVKHRGGHLHDFGLEAFQAAKGHGVEAVFGEVQRVGLLQEFRVLLTEVVHEAPCFAVFVVGVLGAERLHGFENLLFAQAFFRQGDSALRHDALLFVQGKINRDTLRRERRADNTVVDMRQARSAGGVSSSAGGGRSLSASSSRS